jgi:endonuclease/exonuclease/phosphatase family metal-dependent hydrolase
MKKKFPIILALANVILFFIHLAGTLVESIYILDLMNSRLDAKVLGILFFFTPPLLIPFYKKAPRLLAWICFAILFVSRGLLPYLGTANRMLAAGVGTFSVTGLFFLLLYALPKGEAEARTGLGVSAGFGLAIGLSVFLRTADFGLDYSLVREGGWIGWSLGVILGIALAQLEWNSAPAQLQGKKTGVTGAVIGIFMLLALAWFAFSAPAVIARWTEGNYAAIVIVISLLALGWMVVALSRPGWIGRISPGMLLLWNLLFTVALTGTILVHRVPFPKTPDSAAVVVGAPAWWQQVPLILMLLLFPVIFLDMRLFVDRMRQAAPSPRQLAPGMLLGMLIVVLLVFIHIFTNVWGYVAPVSTPFRGQFYLPYLVLAGLTSLLVWRAGKSAPRQEAGGAFHWYWMVVAGVLCISTVIIALPGKRVQADGTGRTSLVVMTINTQQSNDDSAERSFDRQLALIRRVDPDILALQETDSTRISLNNNDYVRYFAENLGYYSYYGPFTVTGTYGTAILSRFPLLNPRTVFSYSDSDEIGTAEAEVQVGGRLFTIYCVHPDGSETAMLAFARALLERSEGKPNVIALGDYNLRDDREAFKQIAAVYTEAWLSVYPDGTMLDGVDLTGKHFIDHIFMSPALQVREPVYILPPDSATDHPVLWAEITWGKP